MFIVDRGTPTRLAALNPVNGRGEKGYQSGVWQCDYIISVCVTGNDITAKVYTQAFTQNSVVLP